MIYTWGYCLLLVHSREIKQRDHPEKKNNIFSSRKRKIFLTLLSIKKKYIYIYNFKVRKIMTIEQY